MLTRRDTLIGTAALIASATLPTHEPVAAGSTADPTRSYLRANLAFIRDHAENLTDADLIAIDREFLAELMGDGTARAEWDAWRAAYGTLQEAIDQDALYLRSLLGRVCDAGGNLATAN
jgi:hypothetical protein